MIPVKNHSISIDSKQIQSNANPFKDAYYFSILDHIKIVLNNPSLKNEMYFKPGIETTNKQNYGMILYGKNHHYLNMKK